MGTDSVLLKKLEKNIQKGFLYRVCGNRVHTVITVLSQLLCKLREVLCDRQEH